MDKCCIFPKKGNFGLTKNYGGITLTSTAAKVYNVLYIVLPTTWTIRDKFLSFLRILVRSENKISQTGFEHGSLFPLCMLLTVKPSAGHIH